MSRYLLLIGGRKTAKRKGLNEMAYHYEICQRNALGEPWVLACALNSSDCFPLFVAFSEQDGVIVGQLFARKVFH